MVVFQIKRIYEPVEESDGYRVLVDRLWPRGISKERGALDEWAKEIAPSTELRKWFDHVPERFPEFGKRYMVELANNSELTKCIYEWKKHPVVTFLFGARDVEHNEAVILLRYLQDR